jgi:hypothetical protein
VPKRKPYFALVSTYFGGSKKMTNQRKTELDMPTNHAASHADDGIICQIYLHKHILELGCVSTNSF